MGLIDVELEFLIADEIKALSKREGLKPTISSSYWRVGQEVRSAPDLLVRDVCVLAFLIKGRLFLFFTPSLMRWREKEWESTPLSTSLVEMDIKYPVSKLYPRHGTEEDTSKKLKILLEYAWLMANLLNESDIDERLILI